MSNDDPARQPIEELLRQTQTDVTPDPDEGFRIAELAFQQAETPLQRGVAARQAAFRAAQLGKTRDIVDHWFDLSRQAFAGDDPESQRGLAAAEVLTGRAYGLFCVRMGEAAVDFAQTAADATAAFGRAEAILQRQHVRGQTWDRFGTMADRHRATHEAMSGDARLAARVALRGTWRAVRARKEGSLAAHTRFVLKQLSRNALAGTLAASRALEQPGFTHNARQWLALKLLDR